jgi:pimeloyl-ACP methyl ester carboxylesterase
MSTDEIQSGFATIDNAQIYYETRGKGVPFVMIHAGVADSRQWNNEFAFFGQSCRMLRYDMRGFGKSQPVAGDFRPLDDLVGLLERLKFNQPAVLMGCSMGGGLAMDYALTYPGRVRALIMVDSGPGGLELEVPESPKYKEAERAYEAGDLERVAEIETQIWFDGVGRTPEQVNQAMRKLLNEMAYNDAVSEARQLGKRLPNTAAPAFDRLGELKIPVLVIVGAHDTPYSLAAADYMMEKLPAASKAIIQDAAHLPNMDQPEEFQRIVEEFLGEKVPRGG